MCRDVLHCTVLHYTVLYCETSALIHLFLRGTKTTCYLPPPPAGCSTADICGIIGVLQRQPCMEPHPEEELRAVHDQRHLDPRGYVEGARGRSIYRIASST